MDVLGNNDAQEVQNIELKNQIIKIRASVLAKSKKCKKAILSKINNYKIKSKHNISIISFSSQKKDIKQKECYNTNNISFFSLPTSTERESQLNILKKKLYNTINVDKKQKGTFHSSILDYSPNKSYNRIYNEIIDKKISNKHLPITPLKYKIMDKNGFLKRIKVTDSFSKIIKDKSYHDISDEKNKNITLHKPKYLYLDKQSVNKSFQKELNKTIYKESKSFNNKLQYIQKTGKNSDISVKHYQNSLLRIAPQRFSFNVIQKLKREMHNVIKLSNSVKVIKNKKFILKINKKEKKIFNDIQNNLKNLEYC